MDIIENAEKVTRPAPAVSVRRQSIQEFQRIIAGLTPMSSLYVINNTSEFSADSGLQNTSVLFTVKVDGETKSIKVPLSWVPVDLSSFADVTVIARSPDFRKMVTAIGALRVIDPADAERLLSTPGAEVEQRRLSAPMGDEPTGSFEAREKALEANVAATVLNNVKSGNTTVAKAKGILSALIASGAVTTEDLHEAIRIAPPDLQRFMADLAAASEGTPEETPPAPVAAPKSAPASRVSAKTIIANSKGKKK